MFSSWNPSVRRSVTPPTQAGGHRPRRAAGGVGRRWPAAAAFGAPLLAVVLIGTAFVPSASAAQTVQLGTATPFAVLAGTAVTDIPTSSITGDVGLSPAAGTNYAGLTQAEVTGTIYSTDGTGPAGNVNNPALLTTAKNDLVTAFNSAAGQPPTSTFAAGDNQLGGQTLVPGVYAFGGASTANITAASPLVLNGEGNANAAFVFQVSSSLVTASGSVVQLENGANPCNVFWEVDSSATLGSSSTFVGTIMALTSATLASGATVQGRVLARNGDVTLDANTITVPPGCSSSGGTGGSSANITSTGSVGAGGAGSAGTGAAAGAGGSKAVVPGGFPHTGFGGAAHARDDDLIALGALSLAASAGALAMAVRRRRLLVGGQPAARL